MPSSKISLYEIWKLLSPCFILILTRLIYPPYTVLMFPSINKGVQYFCSLHLSLSENMSAE